MGTVLIRDKRYQRSDGLDFRIPPNPIMQLIFIQFLLRLLLIKLLFIKLLFIKLLLIKQPKLYPLNKGSIMLKRNLLSIAVVTAAVSLAACNDTETVTEPVVEPDTTTETTETMSEPVEMTEPMADTEPMAETDAMGEMAATQTIGEMAASNENLTVLTAALQAAGLDSMLMAEDKYTVFAPTDEAFGALLTKLGITKEELLADQETLRSVLPYHVVPMVVKAADIPYGTDIETANSATISISEANVITDENGNTANIVGTDMMATNGVVHVIDTVLLPK